MINTLKTLEKITQELRLKNIPETEIEKTVHSASLMAFVEASHKIVNAECMPTPLYRLVFDNDTNTVKFEMLEGRAIVPNEKAIDINMMDILTASLLREKMPILWEGITGIGKTFTTEKFARTILPPENYRILRLNQNMTNVQQPYIEGRIENGVVKIFLKKEELEKIALLFVDEVNRGDANQVLQLQDGKIILSTGERGELGLPIPRYEVSNEKSVSNERGGSGNWVLDTENTKPVYVVSAQNPPATSDAKYTGTRKNDAAMANRNLTVNIPNSAASIGASTILLREGNGQHKRFMQVYGDAFAKYLGIKSLNHEELKEDWMKLYALTTDPKKTEHPSFRSAMEYMDSLLLYSSKDLVKEFAREKKIIESWAEVLKSHKVDFKYDATLNPNTEAMQKVGAIVNSFEEEIITRDITKAKKLADAFSTIRRLKIAFDSISPVKTYNDYPPGITIEDIACAGAVMLNDKQAKHDVDSTTLVDTVLRDYVAVAEKFAAEIGYRTGFSTTDRNYSVYSLAINHAIVNLNKNSSEDIIKDLGTSVSILKRAEAGSETRKPMLCRMIADISTLAGFVSQYSSEINAKITKNQKPGEAISTLRQFYLEKRAGVTTPDIYKQRLPRVLGAA